MIRISASASQKPKHNLHQQKNESHAGESKGGVGLGMLPLMMRDNSTDYYGIDIL
jgi:hypothetical protein